MAGYDWNYWRHLYVSGDDAISLEELRKRPNAPSIGSLKRRSTEESWPEQRKQFRYRAATIALQSETGVAAAQQVEQLIDAAEMITRHIRLARELQIKAEEALKLLEPSSMQARDILAWIKESGQIERLALGMATERQDSTSSDSSMTPSPVKVIRVVVDPKSGTEEDI
jgi:hypothetical protein